MNNQIIVSGAQKIRQEMTLLFMEQDNEVRQDEKKMSSYDWDDRKKAEAYMMEIWGEVCDSLQKKCADPVFNAKVMSPRKTLKGLISYLCEKAHRYSPEGHMAMVRDSDVFNWAYDYYDEDTLKADEKKAEESAKKKAELAAKSKAKKAAKKSSPKTTVKKTGKKADAEDSTSKQAVASSDAEVSKKADSEQAANAPASEKPVAPSDSSKTAPAPVGLTEDTDGQATFSFALS